MKYLSTRDTSLRASAEEAVLAGLAPDGGLYMPVQIPDLSSFFSSNLAGKTFQEISFALVQPYLNEEVPDDKIREIIDTAVNFEAPLIPIHDNIFTLELFHGPTHAFKDFGARFMAQLIAYFLRNSSRELTILVATSGDTGSAVANGFYQVPGVKIVILYPEGQVSELQEKQLTTLDGNIHALEVSGTFDDCQRMVKAAFLDKTLQAKLRLGSANSINIARLLPQTFYYAWGYAQALLYKRNVTFSVPSGNFGNLTAGIIAKRMGLPIKHFIAATNVNDVVPEYLQTGKFQSRPSSSTISNAMDVGNPSNFERLQYLFGGNLDEMRAVISGVRVTDGETMVVMNEVLEKFNYILDPHGAVGYLGLSRYLATHPAEIGIFLETAHPAKFMDVIQNATGFVPELPDSLQAALKKEKRAIAISNDINDLKTFLLK